MKYLLLLMLLAGCGVGTEELICIEDRIYRKFYIVDSSKYEWKEIKLSREYKCVPREKK